MGLLDWLFGSKDQPEQESAAPEPPFKMQGPILLFGREDYPFDIVGESHYQAELEQIAGEKTEEGHQHECIANIVLDNANPYDENAVAVVIGGRTIGHFARHHAAQYREWLQEWGLTDAVVSSSALIVGGWDRGSGDSGNFGVKLDIHLPFQAT